MVREMECQPTVALTINGERREIPAGLTLLGLVGHLGLDPERVAVELDKRIVKRAQWERTGLAEGSQLEIVQFVGGG